MNIFFDLDGTLVDSMPRLYHLFQYLVPQSKLTFEEYWQFKRNKLGHPHILANHFQYSEDQIALFVDNWMANIELQQWIEYDKPFQSVTEYLQTLKDDNTLIVVTARQFNEIAEQQIKRFGWQLLFDKILVTNQQKEKAELIIENFKVSPQDWFIGDTGKDIQTGKALGINTAAVLSGFLSKEHLKQYNPDLIVEDVTKLTVTTLNTYAK